MCGNLFLGGFALKLLLQPRRRLDHLVDEFSNVNRDADRASLVDDGAGNGAANPPRGVRGEAKALAPVELLDGADQAQIAFLDQVGERNAAGVVLLGDGNDQPKVALDEDALGFHVAFLDASRQVHFLLGRQKLGAPGLAHPHFQLFGIVVDLLFFFGGVVVDLEKLVFIGFHGVVHEHGARVGKRRVSTGRSDGDRSASPGRWGHTVLRHVW